jgi:hypothetical protein
MNEPTRTIKVRVSTYQTLRLVAALTGETLLDVCDRVMRAELSRLKAFENAEGSRGAPEVKKR